MSVDHQLRTIQQICFFSVRVAPQTPDTAAGIFRWTGKIPMSSPEVGAPVDWTRLGKAHQGSVPVKLTPATEVSWDFAWQNMDGHIGIQNQQYDLGLSRTWVYLPFREKPWIFGGYPIFRRTHLSQFGLFPHSYYVEKNENVWETTETTRQIGIPRSVKQKQWDCCGWLDFKIKVPGSQWWLVIVLFPHSSPLSRVNMPSNPTELHA